MNTINSSRQQIINFMHPYPHLSSSTQPIPMELNPDKWLKYIYMQGSPSRCVWREIPWVTHVDDTGHECITAIVATAYFVAAEAWEP